MTSRHRHVALLGTFLLILFWSGINPLDRFVWFLEVFRAMVGAVVLVAIYPRVKLMRNGVVNRRKCLFPLVTCVCLAISALYEFVEWWVAVGTGTAADAFLATQGDVRDTQSDMFMAPCGAVGSQPRLMRAHDRQVRPFLR